MCRCWARNKSSLRVHNVSSGARLHQLRAEDASFGKVDDEYLEARKNGHGWVPLKARYGRASAGAGCLSPQSQSVSHARRSWRLTNCCCAPLYGHAGKVRTHRPDPCAVDEYLRLTGRRPGQFLFPGRGDGPNGLTTKQYARLVHDWVASIGLDPAKFGTHSLRRTRRC